MHGRRGLSSQRLHGAPAAHFNRVPVDELEPIGDRHLSDFEWFWVDVYGEFDGGWQDAPDRHRFYDGPHLYPLETVLFLMQDGFVARSMIPWGWVPSHSRPAEDLHSAVGQVKEIWAELQASPKHMLLSMLGVWNMQQ